MSNDNGYEYAPLNPGWIKRIVPDAYADDVLREIILFYVINTPCTNLSSSSIALTEYGWKKDVWKKEGLKKALFDVAGLKRGESFFVVKNTNEMKRGCEQAHMKQGFHKNRDVEKIVIYKGIYCEFLSICYHIRNSFAHGRLAMYPCDGNDIMFVLEDGVKRNEKFAVRSRMILKRSTLKTWMEIIKSGQLPAAVQET